MARIGSAFLLVVLGAFSACDGQGHSPAKLAEAEVSSQPSGVVAGDRTGQAQQDAKEDYRQALLRTPEFADAIAAGGVSGQLYEAASRSEKQVVEELLKLGGDPNWRLRVAEAEWDSSIVRAAVSNSEGSEDAVLGVLELLFGSGAQLGDGDTNIIYPSIIDGYAGVVEFLLERGASPNGTSTGSKWDINPQELAVLRGEFAIQRMLVREGAPPLELHVLFMNPQFSSKMTANKLVEITRGLVRNGAGLNQRDSAGHTPLLLSLSVRSRLFVLSPVDDSVFFCLLDEGADVNATGLSRYMSAGYEETTALHEAVYRTSWVLGSDIDEQQIEEVEACQLAINSLIEAGARVSARNSEGLSPLHIAAKSSNHYAIAVLLQHGARLDLRDGQGKTALDYAKTDQARQLLAEH